MMGALGTDMDEGSPEMLRRNMVLRDMLLDLGVPAEDLYDSDGYVPSPVFSQGGRRLVPQGTPVRRDPYAGVIWAIYRHWSNPAVRDLVEGLRAWPCAAPDGSWAFVNEYNQWPLLLQPSLFTTERRGAEVYCFCCGAQLEVTEQDYIVVNFVRSRGWPEALARPLALRGLIFDASRSPSREMGLGDERLLLGPARVCAKCATGIPERFRLRGVIECPICASRVGFSRVNDSLVKAYCLRGLEGHNQRGFCCLWAGGHAKYARLSDLTPEGESWLHLLFGWEDDRVPVTCHVERYRWRPVSLEPVREFVRLDQLHRIQRKGSSWLYQRREKPNGRVVQEVTLESPSDHRVLDEAEALAKAWDTYKQTETEADYFRFVYSFEADLAERRTQPMLEALYARLREDSEEL